MSGAREPGCDFLCVDDYLTTLVDAKALQSALDLRLIDFLQEHPGCTLEQLERGLGIDGRGLRLLLALLATNRVVDERGQLSANFRKALEYRDLLEAKLDIANFVAPDVLERFALLLNDPARFQRDARIFDLFNYQRCLDPGKAGDEQVRRWVNYTTCLTRYEAQACLNRHDFGRYRKMLDIGGNSGAFALEVCRRHAHMVATVFDLPAVCALGKERLSAEPEGGRVAFIAGNALTDPVPADHDLITFKSMLHDWPAADAKRLLTHASNALDPGGTLLIFERGPFELSEGRVPYSLLPMLLFFRSFREPRLYTDHLRAIGFSAISVETVNLDMPFVLVTARLGGASGTG